MGTVKLASKDKLKIAVIAVVVFLLGLTASYLLLGSRFPWAASAWYKLAQVLPLPVASAGGQRISYDEYRAAQNLGAPEPLEFVIKQAAIKALAEERNIKISQSEVSERLSDLTASWGLTEQQLEANLREAGVKKAAFMRIYVEPEILADKLAQELNSITAEVSNIEVRLNNGENFENLAVRFSNDLATAPLGGDLGFVSVAEIDRRLWQQADKLTEGDWTGPINTSEGYVFIQRLEKQRGESGQPDRLHLKIILIQTVDFDDWLEEQIENISVKRYI